jgi:hypothetical protein
MITRDLKEALREIRNDLDKNHAIRLHRAISWLICAEEYNTNDDDICFIALWISFNSCYETEKNNSQFDTRTQFNEFTQKLCKLDKEDIIYKLLWAKYSQFVRQLIDNQFVFSPFWKSQKEINSDWKASFEQSKKLAMRALANNETALLLSIVLDRLYVLRNQMLHGGATYKSNVNRSQVKDGKNLMLELMPIFIQIMFLDDDWGDISYPVVE